MSKIKKTDLRRDTVESSKFHVGIELELRAVGKDSGDHDEDACYESRQEREQEYINEMSVREILTEHFSLSTSEARSLESYFDADQWRQDRMDNWHDDGCQDDDCSYNHSDGESIRDEMENELQSLIKNSSIKVVSDSSITTNDKQVDAEVCWNYYASKETLKDNEIILGFLKQSNCSFDTSCGLHINLNNYLKIPSSSKISTSKLSFLFDFVADSRRNSDFCKAYGMSGSDKYSMIYNQDDRLEFRFFSPTLDHVKLNHYVSLANTIYKRLAGVKCKLPKKVAEYFVNKMIETNGRDRETALLAIEKVNSMGDYWELSGTEKPLERMTAEEIKELEAVKLFKICCDEHASECTCSSSGMAPIYPEIAREEVVA
jgi:hypothetical protein